jgi:hypothetical protein
MFVLSGQKTYTILENGTAFVLGKVWKGKNLSVGPIRNS